MNCAEIRGLLDAHVDGELDLLHDIEIERHLAGCETCAQAVAGLTQLRAAYAEPALRHALPPGLEGRIAQALPREASPREAASHDKPSRETRPRALTWLRTWPSFSLGAAFACAVFMVWNGAAPRPVTPSGAVLSDVAPADDALATEVLSSHVRALMASHLTDVPSTDQHTVKPWFNGKLDFSPTVQDFAAKGFPLIGGRLDYLAGRPVAALVYRRRRHFINLFVWPAASAGTGETNASAPLTRQGYHLIHWAKAGSTYWAASDLGVDELQDFVRLAQQKD